MTEENETLGLYWANKGAYQPVHTLLWLRAFTVCLKNRDIGWPYGA